MRKWILVALVGWTTLAGTTLGGLAGADAQTLRERMRARLAQPGAAAEAGAPAPAPARTIAYGPAALQRLDFWPAQRTARAGPAPLVLFVHGGGWQRGSKDTATGRWKPVHFPEQGYAFASMDYRLVPQATVEQQAADIAAALRKLIDSAGTLGIDRARVVLMGHSAGAHLVALVGTDERYLKAAGLSFADVAGVIPIDGAAYDVPAQVKGGPAIMQPVYAQAFGSDPARQRALSPTLLAPALLASARSANAAHAPAFLLLHVQRPDGVRQAQAFEQALTAAGARVERRGFAGTGLAGHGEINRSLGDPAYPATPVADDWLRRLFAGAGG